MRSIVYKVLIAMLFCCSQSFAQNVLLPFGQDSQEPWTAKYFYATIGTEEPDENWFADNFDDSAWETLQGPISTLSSISYYVTLWKENYSTYWVRRHFTVDDVNNNRIVYFKTMHDDACEAYLNGQLIYSKTGVVNSGTTVNVTNEGAHLVKGENVLAVKVSDTGRGNAFMDFGLIGASVIEPEFNSSNGWTGNLDRCSYDGNYIGYRYGRNWKCQQSFNGVSSGLYCLSANACGMEYYNDQTNAINAKDNEIPAKLFINDVEKSLPSAFSEIAKEDIYGGNYRWQIEDGYVPYYVDRVPAAFKRDMYKVSLYAYYEPDSTNTMNIGVSCYPSNDISRWAAWDKFNLRYIEEEELNSMLDSLVLVQKALSAQHQYKAVKALLDAYLSMAAQAKTYKEKGQVYAIMSYYEPTVRKTIEAYEQMYATQQMLVDSLKNVNKFTSPATKAEATTYAANVLAAYNDGAYDNSEVDKAIATMNKMMERLGYLYLDITVTTPGALGDSILSKVDNFVDVYSIKVSGTLNDADLSTIQSRLSNLREIDMTDMNMTALPNRFFYQRKALEIVNLPKALESIGEYAFYQCEVLSYLELPTTVVSIGNYAFYECHTLPELVLCEGLTYLGNWSFAGTNIKSVKFPSTLTKIQNNAFYHAWKIAEVDFAEGLENIGTSVFEGCPLLNNINLPATLTYIGTNAFAYCSSLSEIKFNEGLYQIGDDAFYNCDALTEVTLPSSLVLANSSPFGYCDNLTKVTCLSIEPPYITEQIPYGLSMEGRELYVPALSLNSYKQTSGWDKFPTIKPIDYLPENITVLGDLHLTLPENMSEDYKPTVDLIHAQKSSYLQYGQLTVNGEGTLSISDFSMVWDPNYFYDYSNNSTCYTTLINNSHLRSDKVSIYTYTRNNRWTFVSFPFDVKLSDIELVCDGTTNWIIRKYDGQKRADGETDNTWVKLTSDDILNAGEGYILQGSRYLDDYSQNFSGFLVKAINNANKNNLFRTTDIVVPLNEYQSEFAHNRSWNLIGNPYPSFYDTRFMNFNAPITVWNIRNSTYSAYSPVDDSYILCPGEAFFVQCPVGIENITFGKDGRQINRTVRAIQAPAKANAFSVSPRTIINLTISDNQTSDRTRVVLNESAKYDYEADKDAPKFMSTENSVPQLFTTFNGIDYAINERPVGEGSVALGARFGAKGQYSIALEQNVDDCDIVLEDKLTGEMISLSEGNEYLFNAQAGTTTTRFVLHFDNNTTGISSVAKDKIEDGAYYTLEGVKVEKPVRRGFYIHNNKKVIVK